MRTAKLSALLAAAAGLVIIASAQATTYYWTPTAGGSFDWNAATSNWTSGFPNVAGDVAYVNSNITGTQTIRLQQGITIGTLNIGDPDGTNNFTISSGTGTNTLTFDSGASGVSALLTLGTVGVRDATITAPVALNSDLTIDTNIAATSTNRHNAFFSYLDTGSGANARTITIVGGYAGNSTVRFSNGAGTDLLGSGTIIQNGPTMINIESTISGTGAAAFQIPKSFTGTFVLNKPAPGSNANSLTLTNGSIANAAEVIINGAHDGSSASNHLGGFLQMGSGTAFSYLPNQRLTQNKVTFNGGYMNDGGQAMNAGFTSEWITDTVATMDFNSGFSILNVRAGVSVAGNRLTATSVERGAGATMFYRYGLGTTTAQGRWVTGTGAGSGDSFYVGQNGAKDTTTKGIIPWMVSSTNADNVGIGTFATYEAGYGFRVLSASEYTSTFAADTNYRGNGPSSLASDFSLNSMQLTGNSTYLMEANASTVRKITLQSGGLLFSNIGNLGSAGDADQRAGTVQFGADSTAVEGVIINQGILVNGIGASLIGSGGLTKGGSGRIVLTGANTITGDTHVSGGTLQVGDGTYESSIGNGDVVIHNGALLDIRDTNTDANAVLNYISDNADLYLRNDGLLNGKISLTTGIETVSGLFMLGSNTSVAAGYYGSSAAAAAHSGLTVNVNDGYFAGAGLIQVVPEPATIALLSISGLALLRRRR